MKEKDNNPGRDFGQLFNGFSKRAERFLKNSDSTAKPNTSEESQDLIKRYHSVLEKVMAPPLYIGVVVGRTENRDQDKDKLLAVSCNGRLLLLNNTLSEDLKTGDTVEISSKTMQIVARANELPVGDICIVKEAISLDFSEVDVNGNRKLVCNGQFSAKIKENDRVVLDSSSSIIVGWLGNSQKRFKLGNKPMINWDDIGGLKDAKEQLIEVIEMPIRYQEYYRHYNKKPIRGVIVFGPPGCGKTMLLEAVATAIAKLHGQEALESGFINIKGAEILDMYVGVAEGIIRQIFASARMHKKKYGYPAIVVIDEAEALLRRRGSGKSSDVETTIVPAFLTEMQGIDDSDAIVFLATNRVDLIDPGVLRDGRIDRHIEIGRPDRESARKIFELNLKNIPFDGCSSEEITALAEEEFYSPRYKIYDIKRDGGTTTVFTLAHLVNGAMLAGVIDRATSFAMKRDIAGNKKSGLIKDDIRQAVQQTYEQKFNLSHGDELNEFVRDFKDDISFGSIQKVKQAVRT